ncbi:hypothetical protein HAX54_002269, partial [Datura stramonium]|nr:hypothetical protein [Datura stramonium]
ANILQFSGYQTTSTSNDPLNLTTNRTEFWSKFRTRFVYGKNRTDGPIPFRCHPYAGGITHDLEAP